MNSNLASLTDNELLILFQNGNSNAFGILANRHAKSVSFSIFTIVKDLPLVEDLMQDAFIKAMDAIQKGAYAETGTFKAWLIQIGHNLAIDYYRKNKRKKVDSVPTMDTSMDDAIYFKPLIANEPSPEDEIITLETGYELQSLLDKLPPEQKEVIILRHFHDFSFKEIADYIGGDISINTCLGRMRYALINLRKIIKEIEIDGQKVL